MNTKRQIINFLWVGGLNTLVGYSLYAFFIFINLRYFLALLFSTCLGILFNFITIGKFVFKKSNNGVFFKFIATYVFLYLLGLIYIQILKKININLYLSGLVTIISFSIISFTLSKFFVFKDKNNTVLNSKNRNLG